METKIIAVLMFLILACAACAPAALPDSLEPENNGEGQPANFPGYTAENQGDPGKITPVTVDMGQVTPGTGMGGEVIVQPEPGIPNPERKLASLASLDLSERLNVDVSQVQVLKVEAVDWPDSSLGCPKAGVDYLMVITPGYRILLESGGQEYEYHTDSSTRVVLCLEGRPLED